MTDQELKDYFAAKAMSTMYDDFSSYARIAENSYDFAEAMLAERQKRIDKAKDIESKQRQKYGKGQINQE